MASRAGVLTPIPKPIRALIGREAEVEYLYNLLQSGDRLVTITGFGGMGKTRLALQVAMELEPSFEAGVLFAPLSSVTLATSVPMAIAQIAGLPESTDTVAALAVALGSETRLLVLDNLEQIPDVATVVLDLLQALPNVTILATSRTSLELSGEQVYPLQPLATESDTPRQLAAVQLFIERGAATGPNVPTDDASIATIAEICQRLDGIPLAIELAAARLAIFSLQELSNQLQDQLSVLSSSRADLPDRQKTMRNAIRWTYDLMEPAEQRLFNWISVYEGGFSLDSIRHVSAVLELTDDPLDVVQFLVSRSLIRKVVEESATPRYQMLQMLREFGWEQLLASNEDHLARRSHASDMANFAERAEPYLTTSESGEWMARLRDDVPNLLHAMMWANGHGEHELSQRILGNAWRYPDANGMARRFLDAKPDTSAGTGSDLNRTKALGGIGYLYEGIRELESARAAFEQSRDLAEHLEDKVHLVRALTGLGTVEFDYSNLDAAEDLILRAKELAKSIGAQRSLMVANGMLANVHYQKADYEAAAAVYEGVVRELETSGDHIALAMGYANLAVQYQNLDRFIEADAMFRRGLALCEQHGDVGGMASTYSNLSSNCLELDQLEECQEFAEKAIAICAPAGWVHHESAAVNNYATVSIRQKDWGTAAEGMMRAAELMDIEGGDKELVSFASVFAQICIEIDLHAEAAEMLGAVQHLREALQVAANQDRADAESHVLNVLKTHALPRFAERMSQGAGYDRESLMTRMRQISRKIISISPPKKSLPEQESNPLEHLTPRESEVLTMVARGLSNAEIADEMFVSTRTVTTHLTNIFGKLEVTNRSRAAAIAMQAGLL